MAEDFEADFEKAGRGRAAGGAAQLSFDTALKEWRLAPKDKKKNKKKKNAARYPENGHFLILIKA